MCILECLWLNHHSRMTMSTNTDHILSSKQLKRQNNPLLKNSFDLAWQTVDINKSFTLIITFMRDRKVILFPFNQPK